MNAIEPDGVHALDPLVRGEVADAFKRRGILLHLDDGGLGGGEELPFVEVVDVFFWNSGQQNHIPYMDLYTNDFLQTPGGQPSRRQGVFRYAVLAHRAMSEDGSEGFNGAVPSLGSDKMVALPDKQLDALDDARTFMHETGHLLGLNADYLFRNDGFGLCTGTNTFHPEIEASALPSSMRYCGRASDPGGIDYSDKEGMTQFYYDDPRDPANKGYVAYDTNEWARIDLTTILIM